MTTDTHCGYVALIGRPNVGKSTLLNHILGQKISITSRKPQTTRHQILGVKTEGNQQMVFVDTPGMHIKEVKAINRVMNRAAESVLKEVDVIVWLVDQHWTPEEDRILQKLASNKIPVILAVNKIDMVKDKKQLLPYLQEVSPRYAYADVIPVSAKNGQQVDVLEKKLAEFMPAMPFLFAEDQVTDRTERFLAAEIVREKLMRFLGQELPYSVTVEIDLFKENEDGLLEIAATILVERNSQKAMIIGKGGSKLKEIGREARLDMKRAFDQKVFLQLWVKVKSGWSDDERALKSLGYE